MTSNRGKANCARRKSLFDNRYQICRPLFSRECYYIQKATTVVQNRSVWFTELQPLGLLTQENSEAPPAKRSLEA